MFESEIFYCRGVRLGMRLGDLNARFTLGFGLVETLRHGMDERQRPFAKSKAEEATSSRKHGWDFSAVFGSGLN